MLLSSKSFLLNTRIDTITIITIAIVLHNKGFTTNIESVIKPTFLIAGTGIMSMTT